MKHLFVINPYSSFARGRTEDIAQSIDNFFEDYKYIPYDIYVTRWRRDAVGFAHTYVREAKGMVRIYAIGGDGTLFEVINGVMGLPNVQVAACSNANVNKFIKAFGDAKTNRLFSMFQALVFASTIPVDIIRCGHHFGFNIKVGPSRSLTISSDIPNLDSNCSSVVIATRKNNGSFDVRLPSGVVHTVSKLSVSSPEMFPVTIDGENFFDTSMDYEIIPDAIDFVLPGEIGRGEDWL